MAQTTSTLIFELKHQQVDFPRVPHPLTRVYVKFGLRGIVVQMYKPGSSIPDQELYVDSSFITNIDILYIDEPRAEELQMEMTAINGEQVWVVPEIE